MLMLIPKTMHMAKQLMRLGKCWLQAQDPTTQEDPPVIIYLQGLQLASLSRNARLAVVGIQRTASAFSRTTTA
jgi:hypothetical protein